MGATNKTSQPTQIPQGTEALNDSAKATNETSQTTQIQQKIEALNDSAKKSLQSKGWLYYFFLCLMIVSAFLFFVLIATLFFYPHCCRMHMCCHSLPPESIFMKVFAMILLSILFVWWMKYLSELMEKSWDAVKEWNNQIRDAYGAMLEIEIKQIKDKNK